MQSEIEQLRHKQTNSIDDTAIGTLRMIEINPIEICNRKCYFCPRVFDEYQNRSLKISKETVSKIACDLHYIQYTGRVGFVGYGEPTLHKQLPELIRTIAMVQTIQWIEVNTNGDFLTREKILEYKEAGCTNITVSMYDKDISDILYYMADGIDIEIVPRHCYPSKFELSLVNRNEIYKEKEILNIKRNCYIPAYKMFIDWNGDILICSEDWRRVSKLDNVLNTSIKDIWLNNPKLRHYRKNLFQANRAQCNPCNKCDINGTKFGTKQAETLKNSYI